MPPSDEAAIRALVIAYAERLDAGDLDGVAELFSHAEVCSARDGSVRRGTAEVRRMYDQVVIYDDSTPRTKHVLGNLVVTIDDDGNGAGASCTFTVMQAAVGEPLRAVLAGRYVDRFSRAADDTWRFAARTIHPDLLGDLSRHMGSR